MHDRRDRAKRFPNIFNDDLWNLEFELVINEQRHRTSGNGFFSKTMPIELASSHAGED